MYDTMYVCNFMYYFKKMTFLISSTSGTLRRLLANIQLGLERLNALGLARTNARRKIDGRMLELPAVCLMILSR